MDRDKIGHAISAAVSTFLTVYLALRIGKAIGRREAAVEIAADYLDRWREQTYPEPPSSDLPERFYRDIPPPWWEQPIVYRSIIAGIVGAFGGMVIALIVSALI